MLVTGGRGYGWRTENDAEIYDPLRDEWHRIDPPAVGRYCATAVRLEDGRVLIAGGAELHDESVAAELFDPATESWQIAATPHSVRYGAWADLQPDGTVLVIGGTHTCNGQATGDCGLHHRANHGGVEVYDPVADTWSEGAIPSARYGPRSIVHLEGGNVVAISNQSVEVFDWGHQSWSSLDTPGAVRSDAFAALLPDGRVLWSGGSRYEQEWGEGGREEAARGSAILELSSNTWHDIEAIPTRQQLPALAYLLDGRILIAGGLMGSYDATDAVALFEPSTQSYRSCLPLSAPMADHTLTQLVDGRIMAVGYQIVTGPTVERFSVYR